MSRRNKSKDHIIRLLRQCNFFLNGTGRLGNRTLEKMLFRLFSAKHRIAKGRGSGVVSEREYPGRRRFLNATIRLMVHRTGASDHGRLD